MIRPAAILYFFAVMMTSLCHEYWQFMLVHGILMGTAMDFLQFPALATVSQYFNKKRAAALGIAISRSSIGGGVQPIALSNMLNNTSLGFGWMVRAIGFALTPLLAFSCMTVRSCLTPRASTFSIRRAWTEARFVMLVVALFFMLLSMFIPLFFIPTYAITRGIDAALASYLLAIINAASTFGRVIPGVLPNKHGQLDIFSMGGVVTGIILFCMNQAENTAGSITYPIFHGFAVGTIFLGCAAAFSICSEDPQSFGTYTGVGMAVGSLAVLVGPPINGSLIDRYGGLLQVSMFSGIMCLVGGSVAFASKAATSEGLFGRF